LPGFYTFFRLYGDPMALTFFERRSNDSEMTFIDHLEELRGHIVRSVLAILIAAIVIFIKIDWVFDNIVMGPVRNNFVSYRALCNFSHKLHIGDALCMPPIPPGYKLLGNTVSGPFMSAISIAMIGGLIIAFPYLFWELWKFIKPALSPKEIK
jgi:sec-independent protein translocase protein TatC